MVSAVAAPLHPASRIGGALLDLGGLLAVIWAIPVIILIVGAPIAGAIALVLWLARLVSGGF